MNNFKKEVCGVRWIEWNKKDQQVRKEKFFTSEKLRANFIKRLEVKDNFQNIESYWEIER